MKNKEDIKRLLIVVDMVNGFVRDGIMADCYIEHIVPRLNFIIDSFIYNGDDIIFIKDSHELGCKEFDKFPIHCLKNTIESELIDEFKEYEKYSMVYEKNSTNAMYAPNFMSDLEKMKSLREVIVTGCCSDICVINLAISLVNYFDQRNMDVIVHSPSNLIETYNGENHNRNEYNEMALRLMKQSGIKVSEM